MSLGILVVDADPSARESLIRLLENQRGFRIVGQAARGCEALEACHPERPEVLCLDARTAEIEGLDWLQRLPFVPLVILTTGQDGYAPRELRDIAFDELTIPSTMEHVGRLARRLQAVMAWALFAKSPRAADDRILVSFRDVLKPVRFDQIVYLESREKTTVVQTPSEAYETDLALAEIEARLPRSNFVRIHRRHVVNRAYISGLRRWGNRLFSVELSIPSQAELFVSRRCVSDVLRRLGDVSGIMS